MGSRDGTEYPPPIRMSEVEDLRPGERLPKISQGDAARVQSRTIPACIPDHARA